MLSKLTHPLTAFIAGALVAVIGIYLILKLFQPSNRSAESIADYHARLRKIDAVGLKHDVENEQEAIARFKAFLQGIGDPKYVRENTLKVYTGDAYLDDTLTIHQGAAEIESYFLKTSETMTSYQVTIDDVAGSDSDYYVRWTMVFAAPALNGGKPVHSVGVSQIRFNREGKVEFHQDFWDSGKHFYAHLPVVGGAVGFVRKQLESN